MERELALTTIIGVLTGFIMGIVLGAISISKIEKSYVDAGFITVENHIYKLVEVKK